MKRHNNEPFTEYKERRVLLNKIKSAYMKGRVVRPGLNLLNKVNKPYVKIFNSEGVIVNGLKNNPFTGKFTELCTLSLIQLKNKIGMEE